MYCQDLGEIIERFLERELSLEESEFVTLASEALQSKEKPLHDAALAAAGAA
jgi:hypothetical protein